MTHDITIGGIKIQFPFKPYPSQISMMEKIIRSLKNSENALLESPTGSGKSLAILCASLAWIETERERIKAERMNAMMNPPPQDEKARTEDEKKKSATSNFFKPEKTKLSDTEEDNDDGLVKLNRRKTGKAPADDDRSDEEDKEGKKVALPKVYIGTRTNKQISQMVRELKSTGYKPRISILGSREQYCIHPVVSRSGSKKEDCKDLLEENSCQYFTNVPILKSSPQLRTGPQYQLWDIEDLVQLGKKRRGCPYFTAKSLAQHADIIFCPYNYLIDPQIRKSMEITLEGNVLILDEAHNIEDFAREAGSFDISEDQLHDCEHWLQRASAVDFLAEEHNALLFLIQKLQDWTLEIAAKVFKEELEKKVKVWTGKEMKEIFETLGVTSANFFEYRAKLDVISASYNDEAKTPPVKIPTPIFDFLNRLLMILNFVFRPDKDFANDYRMVLTKAVKADNTSSFGRRAWSNTLSFWCMNPRVIFGETAAVTKCIVLTSGTLSPMDTFASELGVEFPLRLEAMHVIPQTSVWVGGLGSGPDGGTLVGTFKNMDTLLYQDRVANVVLDVVQTVPFGVLCFFSSYKNLEKMTDRWKATGIWGSVLEYKVIVVEPRTTDKEGFETVMKKYYSAISLATKEKRGKKTGALFLAVCRGKVSEGLDFTDDNARAVIAVGIPFANSMNDQVELKKAYNDQNASSLKLLTGNSWYEIQAYRALNQALGRCIRHKNDWGAIILVDSRFSSDRSVRCLSKWVRTRFKNFLKYPEAMASLTEFIAEKMKEHIKNPPQVKERPDPFVDENSILCPPGIISKVPAPLLSGHSSGSGQKRQRSKRQTPDSKQMLLFNPSLSAKSSLIDASSSPPTLSLRSSGTMKAAPPVVCRESDTPSIFLEQDRYDEVMDYESPAPIDSDANGQNGEPQNPLLPPFQSDSATVDVRMEEIPALEVEEPLVTNYPEDLPPSTSNQLEGSVSHSPPLKPFSGAPLHPTLSAAPMAAAPSTPLLPQTTSAPPEAAAAVSLSHSVNAVAATAASGPPKFKVRTLGKSSGDKKRLLQEFSSPFQEEPVKSVRKLVHHGPLPGSDPSPQDSTVLSPIGAQMIPNHEQQSQQQQQQQHRGGPCPLFPSKLTFCCTGCRTELLFTEVGRDNENGFNLGSVSEWIGQLPLETVRTSFGCTLKEVFGSRPLSHPPATSGPATESFAHLFLKYLSQGDSQKGLLDVSMFVFRNSSSVLATSSLTTTTTTTTPGFLNAVWSEGDMACFRLFYCPGCSQQQQQKKQQHPIAVQLLAVRGGDTDPSPLLGHTDNLWILPEMIFFKEAEVSFPE